jgi:chitodextrinase
MRMIFDYESLINSEDPDDWTEWGIVSLRDKAPNGPLYIWYAEADTNLGEIGVPIEFVGLAVDGYPPHEYQWEFGDGKTSSEPNPTHTYDEAGEYDYTLTVTDAEGAQESYSGSIEILEGDTDDTPGFEFIIAIMAIGFIFLWKKKR